MKLCRFNDNRLGLVRDQSVYDVSDVLEHLPAHRYPCPRGDQLIAHLDEILAAANDRARGKPACAVDEARFLSPVANPTKIIAAPVNYQAHIEEAEADQQIVYNHLVARIDQAGLFLKASSSLVGPGEGITVRFPERRTDQEIEVALIIGRECAEIAPGEDPLSFVAGYAIGLDISVRGTEDRSFRKSLDSYTVLGPWLVTADEIPDPDHLDLSIKVNGAERQRSNTSRLIYDVRKLLTWAAQWYTLYPGDILLTGTPEGVGSIAAGDVLDCAVERVGTMRVAVRAWEPPSRVPTGAATTVGRR